MMGTQAVEDIGRRVVAFLEQALPGREPERDIPLAQAILADLLAIVPEEDPGWSEGIERAAAVVADWLKSRPKQWNQAIRLVGIYFNNARVDVNSGHTRVQSAIIGQGNRDWREVPVAFAVSMIRALIRVLDAPARLTLFERMDTYALDQLMKGLVALDLDVPEMAALLRRSDELAVKDPGVVDFGRRNALDRVREWAGAQDAVAREIVDRWLRRDPALPRLEPASIAELVEGVVTEHPEHMPWRDEVIARLNRHGRTDELMLAVWSTCTAWPQGTPVQRRHAALIELLRSSLAERGDATGWAASPIAIEQFHQGLQAVARDANDHPVEAVATALALLDLAPDERESSESRQAIVAAVCDVAAISAWRLVKQRNERPESKDGAPVDPEDTGSPDWRTVLDVALALTVEQVGILDRLLGDLYVLAPALIQPFLGRWLAEHGRAILAGEADLERLLPFFHSEYPETLVRWLAEYSVQPYTLLRAVAVTLLIRTDRPTISVESLEGLDDVQAMACMHQLIGAGAPGDAWIWTLFRLAHARPQLLEEVATILIDDAVPTYPGKCRSALDALWGPRRMRVREAAVEEAIDAARERIEARLAANDELHRQKLAVPEIVTTRPCAARWREASEQAMQAALERERRSGRFPLLAMMPQVPIARGDASIHRGSDEPIRFAEISRSFELPLRDLIDPVAAELARRAHLADADALLSSLHPADDDESAT